MKKPGNKTAEVAACYAKIIDQNIAFARLEERLKALEGRNTHLEDVTRKVFQRVRLLADYVGVFFTRGQEDSGGGPCPMCGTQTYLVEGLGVQEKPSYRKETGHEKA